MRGVSPSLLTQLGFIPGALSKSLTHPSCPCSAAAPSANNTVMFAAKYNKNTALALKIVALNSFVSILTLPIMIALSQI